MGVMYAMRRLPRTFKAALTMSSRRRARIQSEMTERTKKTPYRRLSTQIVTRMTDSIGMVAAMLLLSASRQRAGADDAEEETRTWRPARARGRAHIGGVTRSHAKQALRRGAEGEWGREGGADAGFGTSRGRGRRRAAQAILRQTED